MRTLFVPILFAWLAIFDAACFGQDAVQDAAEVFKVDGRAAVIGVLTGPENGQAMRLEHNSSMLQLLDGYAGEIDRRGLSMLRRFAALADTTPVRATHVATLHLLTSDGRDRRLRLLDDEGKLVWAHDADRRVVVSLPRVRLDALAPGWDQLAQGEADALPTGQAVDLPGPYIESPIRLDSRVTRDRLGGGDHKFPSSGLTRDLREEQLWVRLPSGHAAGDPPGVLIWVSPMPRWRIPEHFAGVLDELGLIACGVDNAGNQRNVSERLQLMFDALANVKQRWPVDRARVYVTGFSGGGRCASMLHLGWPEVFAGSVPLVGLNTYHRVDAEQAGMVYPAQVGKPRGARLKQAQARRMWSFTGETDFNRHEMQKRTGKLEFDGFAVKLTTVPGIGHEMPPVEDLAEAVRWVDAPRRESMAADQVDAAEALRAIDAEFGTESPAATGLLAERCRAGLVEITREWPWTKAAWDAAERLGYTSQP